MPLKLENLTLDNWRVAVTGYSATKDAVINTLELGVLTGTLGVGLAVIVAYAVNRKLFRGYQTLAYLSVAPTVVPAIVLAAGLLIAYSGPPFFSTAPFGSCSSLTLLRNCPSAIRRSTRP